jgi:hypothetical protein
MPNIPGLGHVPPMDFHRGILEASALFVTLLFLITQDLKMRPWLSLVAFFFILAAFASLMAMIETSGDSSVPRLAGLLVVEVVSFAFALFLLGLWFFLTAWTPENMYFLLGVFAYIVVVSIFAGWLSQRRLRSER